VEIKLVQMSIEIEKKFLISSTDFKKDAFKKSYIKQGFLNSNKNRVVRIRIIDEQGFITVKGISFDGGTSRFEWEKEIPKSEAEQLFLLCEKEVIEKIRYFVKTNIHILEVDEFLGKNIGLCIAEVELSDAGELFDRPKWLGEEVTGEKKYYNNNLSKRPYETWKRKPQNET
jgi:adenylate cyclase